MMEKPYFQSILNIIRSINLFFWIELKFYIKLLLENIVIYCISESSQLRTRCSLLRAFLLYDVIFRCRSPPKKLWTLTNH